MGTSFSVYRVGTSAVVALRGTVHADVPRADFLLEDTEYLAAHLGRDFVLRHFDRGPADENAKCRPAELVEPSDDSAATFIEKSKLVLLLGESRRSAGMRAEMDERGIGEGGIERD